MTRTARQSIFNFGTWLLYVLFPLLCFPSPGLSQDGGWGNLGSVTRRRDYDFIARNRTCVSGSIVALDTSSVTVEARMANTRYRTVLQSSNLIRVTDGGSMVHNAIFNGRSSWADVEQAGPRGPRERMLVVTSDGREHSGASIAVSEDSLPVSRAQRREILRKSDVRRVLYLRVKPLTATAEYMAQENVLIDPELWWDGLFLGKISVPLYDASVPEDNAQIKCANP